MEQMLLVGAVVLATQCVQGISGFGATVLALPFIIWLAGIRVAVPFLVSLSWIMAVYIVLRSHRSLRWPPLMFIVIHLAIGLPGGMLLYDHLPERALRLILAVFMIMIGLRSLIISAGRRVESPSQEPLGEAAQPLMRVLLILGGVLHGAFGTGGPFAVVYASKVIRDKGLFRVTLCMLWLLLNTILLTKWTLVGNIWSVEIGVLLTAAIPFLVVGTLCGDLLHHRVNENAFRKIVHVVLVLSGMVMFCSSA